MTRSLLLSVALMTGVYLLAYAAGTPGVQVLASLFGGAFIGVFTVESTAKEAT